MLAWSPDGSVYIMVTNDHIDICAFEVCNVNFCNATVAVYYFVILSLQFPIAAVKFQLHL